MALRMLWKSMLAFLLFEFRDAYVLLLLAGISLAYPMEEIKDEIADAGAADHEKRTERSDRRAGLDRPAPPSAVGPSYCLS